MVDRHSMTKCGEVVPWLQ